MLDIVLHVLRALCEPPRPSERRVAGTVLVGASFEFLLDHDDGEGDERTSMTVDTDALVHHYQVSAAMLACNIVADIIRDSRPAIRLEDDAQSLNGDAEKC